MNRSSTPKPAAAKPAKPIHVPNPGVQEVSAQFGLRCVSILTLAELIETFAQGPGDAVRISREELAALRAYQQEWGVASVSPGAKAGAE
jgi:hypothetical protein